MKLIKGNRHRVVDQIMKRKAFPDLPKYREGFSLLVTIHKYEVNGENKVGYLGTPFGKVKILIDEIEVSYNMVKNNLMKDFVRI